VGSPSKFHDEPGNLTTRPIKVSPEPTGPGKGVRSMDASIALILAIALLVLIVQRR
jgi:hypothetical protein